jgi:hypothetical protein
MRTVVCVVVACSLIGCFKAVKTPKKVVKNEPKCVELHKEKTPNVGVLIQRCRRAPNEPRVTIIVVGVFNMAEDGRVAAEESVKIVTNYLGFIPKLALITMNTANGIPFYIFAVTGVADGD